MHAYPTLDEPVLDVCVFTQACQQAERGRGQAGKGNRRALGQHWPIATPIHHIHCTWQDALVGRRVVDYVVDILQVTDKC
jgi:hypothetical protein